MSGPGPEPRSRPRRRAWVVARTIFLFAYCEKSGTPMAGATMELECQRYDYPCAAANVAPEIAREGIRIGEEALDRFAEDGADAALAWVREQNGVAHAIGDGVALRFRLKGGRPVWVLTAPALGREEPSVPERLGARNPSPPVPDSGRGTPVRIAAASLMPDIGAAASVWAVFREVAGRDRNEDRKVSDRDFRRALVLDPFHWEWSRLTSYHYREGSEITRLLEATPGYEGGVVRYLRDHQAGEEAFKGWNTYDVVHFAGHGYRICDYADCYSVLFTGDTVSSEGLFVDETLGPGRETGVFHIPDPSSGELILKRHVGLGEEWFAKHYQGITLDRTLVVLNGCETMNLTGAAVPDFLRPLLGSGGSTTVGWTEVVPGEPAQKAVLSLYRQMSEHGLTAGEVMQRLERENLTTAVNTEGETARLRAGNRSGSAPRHARIRIREVVSILAPDGRPLTDGLTPPEVVGGSPDDGRRDTLHVDLLVDGVLPEQLGRWSMALELNGRTLRSGIRLSARQKVGEHAYRVPVTNVPAGKDFKRERPDTLEAVVSLPEGSESRSTVMVRLASFYWTLSVSGGPAAGRYLGPMATASIDSAGRVTAISLYTGTEVRPDVTVQITPPTEEGYEPGASARRGSFEVLVNRGDPNRVELDLRRWNAQRVGLLSAPRPEPGYPPAPTVQIESVDDGVVVGTAEGVFWQVVPQHDLGVRGTMRVEFRARACRTDEPQFARCAMVQPSR